MRILFAVQGRHGRRIAANVGSNAPPGWELAVIELPARLPAVIDDPGEALPDPVPRADLFVSLHETPGAADLIPDIAAACGARAVIAPVDDRAACPPGLENQVRKRLAARGIACAFPRPFCSFEGGPHELLTAFAAAFGRPALRVTRAGDRIASVEVIRDSPCGAAREVSRRLAGARIAESPDAFALGHHHYPCFASMAIDPEYDDTLMHVSGYIFRAVVKAALGRD